MKNEAKFVVAVSKGLIRGQSARRSLMFYSMIAALVWLFLGATFFDTWLRERPVLFLLYWAGCAWVTFLTVLLALFDMLLVRRAALQAKRELAQQILKTPNPNDADAP